MLTSAQLQRNAAQRLGKRRRFTNEYGLWRLLKNPQALFSPRPLAGMLGSLLPLAGEGLGMRVFVKAGSLAITLPSRARTGLQACAAPQADSVLSEFPASPPGPSPASGRGEKIASVK